MLRHTSKAFEADLTKLKEKILRMGALVETAIDRSMKSLLERDPDLARACIADDAKINQLEMVIDEQCVEILALRQPVGVDLRLIITGLKITTDLERIGDLATNICGRSIELAADSPLKPLIDLPRMSEKARGMVRKSLDAYVSEDPDLAEQVLELDDDVDRLNEQVFRELLTFMMEDPHSITRAMALNAASRYFERIADHATNIAEMVIYLVKGTDVRHTPSPKKVDAGG